MSETNVARAGKRGNICVRNNVSATMCPRLPVPLRVMYMHNAFHFQVYPLISCRVMKHNE